MFRVPLVTEKGSPFLFVAEDTIKTSDYVRLTNAYKSNIEVYLVLTSPVELTDLLTANSMLSIKPCVEVINPAYNHVTNPSVPQFLDILYDSLTPDFKRTSGAVLGSYYYVANLSSFLSQCDKFAVKCNVADAGLSVQVFGRIEEC